MKLRSGGSLWSVDRRSLWSFVITAGDRGSVVTHKAAVAVNRTVWISTAFGDAHPELYDLVALASDLPFSKVACVIWDHR